MRPFLKAFLVLSLLARSAAAHEHLRIDRAASVNWAEMVRLEHMPHARPAPRAVPRLRGPAPREVGSGGPGRPTAAEPVVSPVAPAPEGPTVGGGFAALGDDNTAIPPDTMGAAGPAHLLTMLNSQVRIQGKTGGTASTVSLSTFWTAGTGLSGEPFDPHVVYDSISGRWIATVFAEGNTTHSKVWFAMSATADPTGAWAFYQFVADGSGATWADFPGFGVNVTWVGITANMFTVARQPGFTGAKMWVIDKATALAGGPLGVTVFAPGFDDAGSASGFALKPAVTYSAAEPTLFVVDNSGWTAGGTPLVRLSRVTGTGAAPVWSAVPGSAYTGSGLFPVAHDFDFEEVGAPQAGTSTTVDAGDTRASESVYRNGRLWFAHGGTLPAGAPTRNAVFWYQVDPAAMPAPIVQSGVLDGGAGVHFFFPSIAANAADDALIGFSRASASVFVGAAMASRFGTDPAGTMTTGPTLLKAGEATYVKDFGSGVVRWGDFSATCVDPSDDASFWTIQEYAATDVGTHPNDDRWGTWWGTTNPSVPTTTTSTTIPDDTGFVPPDTTTGRCEDGVARALSRYVGRVVKCHVRTADSGARGLLVDDEECESNAAGTGAKERYDAAIAKLAVWCSGCAIANGPALRASTEAFLDDNNGQAYCAGTTPFQGTDETGFVPPDTGTAACEDGVTRALAKYVASVIKCHVKAADAARAARFFDDDVCESNPATGKGAKEKYDAAVARLTGCSCAIGNAPALRAAALSFLENNNGQVYCAGTTPLP